MSIHTPTWHLVAHRCELASPGDFVCLPLRPGVEVAVANMGGEIVAFDNRCPHRGARIFTELRGNRPPVCAYHGRCARADQVATFGVAWSGDFLMVAADPGPPIFLKTGDGLLEAAPSLRLHSVCRFVMDCDWTVAVENALDNEHVRFVHGSSLASLGLQRKDLWLSDDGSSIEYFHSTRSEALDRLAKLFPGDARPADYTHAYLSPYAAVASLRGWTYAMQHYLPRADGRTEFISRLFVRSDAPARLDHFFATVAANNELVFREDAEVCALVAPGHASQLGLLDDRIAHFRGALAGCLAKGLL